MAQSLSPRGGRQVSTHTLALSFSCSTSNCHLFSLLSCTFLHLSWSVLYLTRLRVVLAGLLVGGLGGDSHFTPVGSVEQFEAGHRSRIFND